MKNTNLTLWKLKRWLTWWRFADAEYLRHRRRQFTALTGLHSVWIGGRQVSDLEIIAIQARKIKGLDMQLNQQRKGYQRKVAKLERHIVELSSGNQRSIPSEASSSCQTRDELLNTQNPNAGGKRR